VKNLEGFAEFVAVRSTSLVQFGYLLTGDRQLAEDLLQSALLTVAQRWTKVSDPLAYTKRSMVNETVSWWRRRKIREQPIDGVAERASGDDTAESVVRREVFVRALRRLTPKQRAVLTLRFYEDMSEVDTAEVLGCSVGTVKSQSNYALKKLRELAPELADFKRVVAAEAC
jgi:RNA polymerase sigma-70 factor (sigma-E family)